MPLTFSELVGQFGDYLTEVSVLHNDNPPPNEGIAQQIVEKLEYQCHCAMDAMGELKEEPLIGKESHLWEDVQLFIRLLGQCETLVADIKRRADITGQEGLKTVDISGRHARMRINLLERRVREEEENGAFVRSAVARRA